MTLGTHAIVGGFVGALFASNPVLAAVAGFSSHFLMDAIPHWDYKVSSVRQNKNNKLDTNMDLKSRALFIDLSKIALDALLGLVIVMILFIDTHSRMIITGAFIGAVFGMLPDALQFVYWKVRREPLISLQKFHMFMHASTNLNDRKVYGPACQVAIILFVAVLTQAIFIL